MKIEIVSSPGLSGSKIIFPFKKGKKNRALVETIIQALMANLVSFGYTPKQTEIQYSERESVYYFEVIVKEWRPELKADLNRALEMAVTTTVKNLLKREVPQDEVTLTIKMAEDLSQHGIAVVGDGDKRVCILGPE